MSSQVSKCKRKQYKPEAMAMAVDAVKTGMPKAVAARTFQVPTSTLKDRLNGKMPKGSPMPDVNPTPTRAAMGLPEADSSMGPVKKRARLSLKSARKKTGDSPAEENTNKITTKSPKKSEVGQSGSSPNVCGTKSDTKPDMTDCDHNVNTNNAQADDSTETCSKSEAKVPPVSSLENLGNTCFMNSVMQVLRYTPGFLDSLAYLFEDIQSSEKIKRKNKKSEEGNNEAEDENTKKSWKIVKNLYKVYRDLSRLEDEYDEVASDDVMSMAVKPTRLMTSIRDINCMFEGNLQHDAQEFLRCLLCYIQDAEKEGRKFYSQLPQKFSPKVLVNPIMQKFLQSAKDLLEDKDLNTAEILSKLEDSLSVDRASINKVKANLFDKPSSGSKPLESLDESQDCPKAGDTAGDIETLKQEPKLIESRSAADYSAADLDSNCLPNGDEKVNTDTVIVATNEKTDTDINENETARKKAQTKSKPAESKRSKSATRKRKGKENERVDENQQENVVEETQINNNATGTKKRLGMRGAVIVKSEDNLVCKEHNKLTSEKAENQQHIVGKTENGKLASPNVKQEHREERKPLFSSMSESALGTLRFQDKFRQFVSRMANEEDSDSVDCLSDSEDEDIVLKKKREKELHDTPRRSPRKVSSMKSTTPGKLCRPSPLSLSRSDPGVNHVKSNLCFSLDNAANTIQTTSPSSQTDQLPVTNAGTESPDKTSGSDVNSDCTDMSSSSTLVPPNVAMEPVVKLENCDFIFEKNMTTVSAVYASKCLSPTKSTPRKFSSNYLKQKNMMDRLDEYSSDMVKTAIMDMLNSPVKSRSKYDLIERLFQGTMMLRTKCLSCESARERTEDFHDISVPVRIEAPDSDDEDGEEKSVESSPGLLDLIEASTEVEKLQEDNKYFCDECKRYVEAERSIHYDVLPDIVTLHLKRFSAVSGNLGYISKINDHVNIPMTLPCLKYKCPKTCLRPDHKYKLYSIITHSGASLSAGHYLAYVRALPKQPDMPDMQPCVSVERLVTNEDGTLPGEKKTAENSENMEISENNKSEKLPVTRRKAGVAPKLPSRFSNSIVTSTKVKTFAKLVQKKPSIRETVRTSVRFTSEWFECDDETIRVFDEADFIDLLSGKEGSLLGTPYLLFYHKATLA